MQAPPPKAEAAAAESAAATEDSWGDWEADDAAGVAEPEERGGAATSSWEAPTTGWHDKASWPGDGVHRWQRRSEVAWKKRGKRGGWQAAAAAASSTRWEEEKPQTERCPGLLWGEGWTGGRGNTQVYHGWHGVSM